MTFQLPVPVGEPIQSILCTKGLPMARDLPPWRVPIGSLANNLAIANPYGFRFFQPAIAPRTLDVTGAAYDPVTQIFRKADGTALFWAETPDSINPGDPSGDTSQPTQTYYLSSRTCDDTNNDGYIVQDCTDTFDPNPPDSEPDH